MGGVYDDEVAHDDEEETLLVIHTAIEIETVDGYRVACNLGIDDVTSVHLNEAHLAIVFHLSILGLRLKGRRS